MNSPELMPIKIPLEKPAGSMDILIFDSIVSSKYVIRLISQHLWNGCLIEFVDDQSGAKFGFEPGGLGRHDISRVCNIDQLLHGYWE